MPKRTIKAPAAGAPVGPYSQAVVAGNWIFVSGEKGVDPATGKIVDGGIAAQTRQALINIKTILKAAGASMEDVVRCVVYMAYTEDFHLMNEAYAAFFPKDPPARSTVIVAALPLGLEVLIEATAYVDAAGA
ncbi:MAG: Rid family detoxifying hydrolase [Desulfomonile sp.]|nr:Rid family detoxifying hydrolase [Desulfomonile sp.]